AAHRPRDLRRHRGPRPGGPPGRGLRRRRRTRGQRPSRTVHPDAQRRPLADLLRVRLRRPAAALPGDGRPGRGAGGDLPLPHGHRGPSLAHRRQLRLRAERALRAGLHPGARQPHRPGRRRGGVPQLPHRRRPDHRGGRRGARVLPVRALAHHRRLRL
ncbi:MAG: CysO-cysteine peptidase, partial [uncultured Blastococcus sp.]